MLGLPVRYTEGFNPLPRMEFSQPLALGIESDDEMMAIWLASKLTINDRSSFLDAFNRCMPAGIVVNDVRIGKHRSEGKNTIGSLYWGSEYHVFVSNKDDMARLEQGLSSEKPYEFVTVDKDKNLVDITVNDARGGERNIVRLIEKVLGSERILDRLSIRRKSSLVLNDDSGIMRLFDAL